MNTLFATERLTKSFMGNMALRSVDLECPRGRIIGLLGPNGSGKTTLLKVIAGLQAPSKGTVQTFGCEPLRLGKSELSRLGFVQQEMELLEWLTVSEHIEYVASFYRNWDKEREAMLLSRFGLSNDKRVGNLSTGDRQKLAILLSICHHPELLLMDEPASALDPMARSSLLKLLFELVEQDNCSIVISSHVMVDVEKVVDHVWFLDRGLVIENEDLDTLKERYVEWSVSAKQGQALPDRFSETYIAKQSGDAVDRTVYVRDPSENAEDFAARHDAQVVERRLNLEGIFPLLVKD